MLFLYHARVSQNLNALDSAVKEHAGQNVGYELALPSIHMTVRTDDACNALKLAAFPASNGCGYHGLQLEPV